MDKSITRKTTDGLIWNVTQKIASKGLQFLFSVWIARILIPEQYGIIAIANLFISLSDVLIDSGFSKALLRKQQKTKEDFSTVFWFNTAVSIVLYGLLFVCAPYIGAYYKLEILPSVIRVLSLTLVVNALCGIQSLHLIADMNFKKLAILETAAMAAGGIAGLLLAMKGAGVWALVVQTLAGAVIRTILIWAFSKWEPGLSFSRESFKEFINFGSKLLVSEFAIRLYGAVFTLAIGKNYASKELGLYGKADAFSSAPSSFLTGPLSAVTFPAIAQIQDEQERLHKNYVQMNIFSAFILFPIFVGLAAIADTLIPFLLTDKWKGMIPYLIILSFSYLFSALAAIPQNYLLVFGKSDSILKIQMITRLTGIALLFPLMKISLKAVCLDIVLVSFLVLFLTIYSLKKHADYPIAEFLQILFLPCLLSLLMGFCVFSLTHLINSRIVALITGISVGSFLYGALSFILQKEGIRSLYLLFKPYFKK